MLAVCVAQSFAEPTTFKYEIPPIVLQANLPNAGVVTVVVAVVLNEVVAVVESDVVAVVERETVAVEVAVDVSLSLIVDVAVVVSVVDCELDAEVVTLEDTDVEAEDVNEVVWVVVGVVTSQS